MDNCSLNKYPNTFYVECWKINLCISVVFFVFFHYYFLWWYRVLLAVVRHLRYSTEPKKKKKKKPLKRINSIRLCNNSVHLNCLTKGISLSVEKEYDNGFSQKQCGYFRECCQYTFLFSCCLPLLHTRSCTKNKCVWRIKTFHVVVCISIFLDVLFILLLNGYQESSWFISFEDIYIIYENFYFSFQNKKKVGKECTQTLSQRHCTLSASLLSSRPRLNPCSSLRQKSKSSPMHTPFHYHLPIVMIWLKYIWKGSYIANLSFIIRSNDENSIELQKHNRKVKTGLI